MKTKHFNFSNLKLVKFSNGSKTVLLAVITFLVFSCSKDDPAAPLQNPLSGYLTASGFNQLTVNNINNGDYEFGYSFIPSVNGKITALVAKLPDVRSGMRVTIWDKTTATVLRTETIDVSAANVEVIKEINSLDLTKDKEYFITMNSNDWYQHKKTDNSIATYPFIVEDIKITSYGFSDGTTQTMPTSPTSTYYAGDCSFKFQK